MNTKIWGPPLWRLVHSLAYVCSSPNLRLKRAQCVAVSDFMTSLRHVLPCRFCRDSYTGFMKDLQARSGGTPLHKAVHGRAMARWAYDLHECVNTKLDGQLLGPGNRGKVISFDCIMKRHALHPVTVSVDDILDVLFVFALNLCNASLITPEKADAFRVFMCRLPLMVQLLVIGGDTNVKISSDPLMRLLKALRTTLGALGVCKDAVPASMASDGDTLFAIVTHTYALYHGMDMEPCSLHKLDAALRSRYAVVRATACKDGSCI
jgi:hypothetical protein